jgi:hypothetical protein
MAIRFANNCGNCKYLVENAFCSQHNVMVSSKYTCDQFKMKAALKNERSCSDCSKYESELCAHPKKAAPGMLCNSWSPQ